MRHTFFGNGINDLKERFQEQQVSGQSAYSDQQNSFISQPPQVALPNVGGAIRSIEERFGVNAANSAASLSLLLPFFSANCFHPDLSLKCNSASATGEIAASTIVLGTDDQQSANVPYSSSIPQILQQTSGLPSDPEEPSCLTIAAVHLGFRQETFDHFLLLGCQPQRPCAF